MASAAMRHSCRILENFAKLVRIRDWWDFKLSPLAGLFYAVAAATGAPLLPLLPQALLLLAAVAACAAFVSVLNDLTDLEVDRLAGKRNGMAGRTPAARAALLGLPALAVLGFVLLWRHDLPLAAAYAGSFAAFLLYSAPPARLKARGAFGAAADAAGAHLFPSLTAALLAIGAIGARSDPVLLAATAVWSFALGLRGILWHQLGDVDADRRAGVRTLPRIMGPAAVIRVGERGIFPVEIAALLLMLARIHAAAALLFLAIEAAALWRGAAREGVAPAIVRPRPAASIALHDFYGFWLPAAVIVESGLHHPADLLLLAVHLALFPVRARQAGAGLWQVVRPLTPRKA